MTEHEDLTENDAQVGSSWLSVALVPPDRLDNLCVSYLLLLNKPHPKLWLKATVIISSYLRGRDLSIAQRPGIYDKFVVKVSAGPGISSEGYSGTKGLLPSSFV